MLQLERKLISGSLWTRRPGGIRSTIMACVTSLVILGVFLNQSWAEHEAAPADAELPTHGKVVVADERLPLLTLTTTGDNQIPIRVAVDAKVTLNGKPSRLDSLQKGDIVEFEFEEGPPKVIIKVVASRPAPGIFVSSSSDELSVSDGSKTNTYHISSAAKVFLNDEPAKLEQFEAGDRISVIPNSAGEAATITVTRKSLFVEFWENFRHNLFKPLLLFFYMGFSVPILKIAFEFPHVIYQGLTIYLLIAIGWHGGEELAGLTGRELGQALMFMIIGFVTNFFLGILAYGVLRTFTKLRRIDAATVAAYYGSDSAGTFVTCLGVLATANIAYQAYMPVMLAVMEIPGCLVGLYLVSKLRHRGMDALGNAPDEPGYNQNAKAPIEVDIAEDHHHKTDHEKAVNLETKMALEEREDSGDIVVEKSHGLLNPEVMREVFLNPGIFLLFGGILIGYVSGKQGPKVTGPDDELFVKLFQGLLCLFLLEMGMTASRRLKDLRVAGLPFIAFGLIMPNVFATMGILVAHTFSMITGDPLALGTYVLFSVLCAAASYIAVPAVQRLAIPEASPTLPLAASLGLTFSYNVTIGIPVYIVIASQVLQHFPVGG